MTFLNVLESLILGPLQLLFECIFVLSNEIIRNPGLSIIALSLIMNVLVLPLYKRADAMQEEARQVELKLQKGVAHIKKHFSGDERMMILQTYYKQNNYKPTHALKGSVSLLLQIPFFMAAYGFLSNLADLQGTSLGPISNLGAPDGLIVIGGLSINLLPILMTLINVISSSIYLKGLPLKSKIQMYGMAAFFLVFLYTSPSGLVFYWTLNNLFSLGKTIVHKCKVPKIALRIAVSAAGIGIIAFGLLGNLASLKWRLLLIVVGMVLQVGWVLPYLSRLPRKKKDLLPSPNKKLFLAGSIFLTVLVGAVISSTYIAASPQEYVDVTYFYHPLWYVLNALCVSAGLFLVWLRVFYWLASPKGKVLFDRIVWILSGVMVVNYMLFGRKLGILSPTLQYDNGMVFSGKEQLLNILVMAALVALLFVVVKRWQKVTVNVLMIAAVVLGVMSVKNAVDIQASVKKISLDNTSTPQFALSKDGQNVVVIMLDRAMGKYVPYIFNEKPDLTEQFDGFTYYSNTISYGKSTIFGAPPLMGGYEYTPVEMNKADSKEMVDKHNEALKVMPVLFQENGYQVTVCDSPYANYQWIPDLSIYDDYPEIETYITNGHMNQDDHKQFIVEANYRNFFCFSLMKCMPVSIQSVFYDGGDYNVSAKVNQVTYTNQVTYGTTRAHGYSDQFLDSYNVLKNLSTMTQVSDGTDNNFLFLKNDTTHSPTLLQTPDYVPSFEVDNTQYDADRAQKLVLEDGSVLDLSDPLQMKTYHANMAAFVQIGKWLDYLRENDIYDNTRIILVADHGALKFNSDDLDFTNEEIFMDNLEAYFPLLMVKDFNGEGFTVSDEFMTNADVPVLATNGVIENPVNPFTGNPITSDEKYAHDQYLIVTTQIGPNQNVGNTFAPGQWLSITENIWDRDDWEYYDEEVVLKEHAFPE